MAPNLAASQHELICNMILSRSLTTAQMAGVANCSERIIRYIRSNLRLFGSVKAPPIKAGRPRTVTPPMLDALCEHLLINPDLYLDEMASILWDEFETVVTTVVTTASIRRVLKSVGMSKDAISELASGKRPGPLFEYSRSRNSTDLETHNDCFLAPPPRP